LYAICPRRCPYYLRRSSVSVTVLGLPCANTRGHDVAPFAALERAKSAGSCAVAVESRDLFWRAGVDLLVARAGFLLDFRAASRRLWFLQSRGVCLARFHISEDRPHRYVSFQLHRDLGNFCLCTVRRHALTALLVSTSLIALVIRNFISPMIHLHSMPLSYATLFSLSCFLILLLFCITYLSRSSARAFSRDLFCVGSVGRPRFDDKGSVWSFALIRWRRCVHHMENLRP